MRILLLGKDGQVGWQLQRSLAPLGEMLATGRRECDLAVPGQVESLVDRFRPTVIVNASAYTAVDKAESDRERAWALNADLPGRLAESAEVAGALLVHYSTDYVYDGSKATPWVESDPTLPQSEYGRSKLAGEAEIREIAGRSVIFRTSWVFGEHGGNFVKTILRLARERDALSIVADQIGSPTPAALIADTTTAVLLGLQGGAGLAPGEHRLYHLAAANPVSWHEFACHIVATALALGEPLRVHPEAIQAICSADYPTPARRPTNSRLDCRALEQDFGLTMPDWRPYLQRMLEVCLS